MLTPLDFLADLMNPMLAFLPKALLVSVLAAIVCGVIGSHVVLRGMTFIGDAVSHSVFPGIAVAFVLQGSLLVGGIVAGVVTAVLIALFSQTKRLREDSVIGVFFVAAFALGIVVISLAPGYAGSLTSFLFGSITGIPDETVLFSLIMALAVLLVAAAFHKELVAVSLDREYARSAGLPVLMLDVILYVLVTLAVVMSIQTIGNILVLALLVTPAAAARMLTDRLLPMMFAAATIGALSAFVGLYLSWALDVPTGGTIVLVATAVFMLAWAFGPRHGVLRVRFAA
ncbi:anchored repeat-type ABC transporter permease subunit [Tessaracoccus sp. OH4464_COT-324]|uniref:anchored repeat-type ABC transporter permease subunit n=1 Tax=Tessaracoccus sp. OH4464_COT-324 TaxID=2491059 RepID=UPI000F6311B7|nr:anchored repeat-type ABC transporter permease subunit [Tessaracoccus sp. OH4464_COT-324]RRD45199.1 anchored repeat-type ABC transporter permease subunit [Tessaracoccus sp. OH4464_COT-324]